MFYATQDEQHAATGREWTERRLVWAARRSPGAAALEVTVTGCVLRLTARTAIALTGRRPR